MKEEFVIWWDREKSNKWISDKIASGTSMRKLGEMLGMGHGHISRVLSGDINAGLEFYIKIAHAFGEIPEFLRVANILPRDEGLLDEVTDVLSVLTLEERKQVLLFAKFVKNQQEDKKKNG